MPSETDTIAVAIDLMGNKDLPEIMAIEKDSFVSPWSERMFLDELKLKHSQRLVARLSQGKNSIIGGYLIFWIVADEAHLHNLAVKKEFRRQGLAQGFMNVMKEIAHQAGAKSQTLEVRESNTEAIKLYRKCGFVVKGKRPLYYTDTQEDALIMWAGV
ncbi:MAG: ribosomal-protein-alanine N-acetyltransferase [Deltaproteobacteria bacterium HGW-Deltaproteobacteria-12]|jgi:ribosomal-protein-alanine N-acetyltransferase|nr:MAG: ribosomal-protein-alanine N-acetyltransferase [Deltaproteobacteria bacterium HGW-Deltaproteobacteria-12]